MNRPQRPMDTINQVCIHDGEERGEGTGQKESQEKQWPSVMRNNLYNQEAQQIPSRTHTERP